MPGARTVWSGKSGICIGLWSQPNSETAAPGVPAAGVRGSRGRGRSRPGARRGQWEQERGVPAPSAVRKLEPQPQPETAFGLLTVKPAPISVST